MRAAVVLAVVVGVFGLATAAPLAAPKPVWDWMYLVLGWPQSLCDTTQGCHIPQKEPVESWFLHGLWPNFKNGSWPSFCNPAEPYNRTKIADLIPQLEYYWPAVLQDTEDEFWGHEWEKHGTCSWPVLVSEHEYFLTTLKYRQSLNLTEIMQKAGVSPADTPYFTAEQFANRFGKTFGYMPDLRCNTASDGTTQLHELWLCIDPNGQFMDCPLESHTHGAQYSQCGTGSIHFPVYKPSNWQ
jgi:ribonuclease T2